MRTATRSDATVKNSSRKKAVRRTDVHWIGSYDRPSRRRSGEPAAAPQIVRFPLRTAPAIDGEAFDDQALARRLRQVQAGWNDAERERRRLEAVRKQDELLAMLAAADLEDSVRQAVADGEQPVTLPEIDLLRPA